LTGPKPFHGGAEPEAVRESFHFTRRQSVALVFACTIIGAFAQVLFKFGANGLETVHPIAMLTHPLLLGGYALYGLNTVLLVLALRDGELSLLYPVISLTFGWVAILSVVIFDEKLNLMKLLGISTVILGVAILGHNGRK
jgi:undecaprenyl phosphate-alpha-L-ara4N flippase subunit ArnE